MSEKQNCYYLASRQKLFYSMSRKMTDLSSYSWVIVNITRLPGYMTRWYRCKNCCYLASRQKFYSMSCKITDLSSYSLSYCKHYSSSRLRDSVVQMQSLLLCLPSLRAADAALRRYWLSVRHQGSVPMNKLFVEMLESHMRWGGSLNITILGVPVWISLEKSLLENRW